MQNWAADLWSPKWDNVCMCESFLNFSLSTVSRVGAKVREIVLRGRVWSAPIASNCHGNWKFKSDLKCASSTVQTEEGNAGMLRKKRWRGRKRRKSYSSHLVSYNSVTHITNKSISSCSSWGSRITVPVLSWLLELGLVMYWRHSDKRGQQKARQFFILGK